MVGTCYFLTVDSNSDPNPFLIEATRLNNLTPENFSCYGLKGDLLPDKVRHIARSILYDAYLKKWKHVLKLKILELLKAGTLLEMSVVEIEDVLIKEVMRSFVEKRIYGRTRSGYNRIENILDRSYRKKR